MKSGTHDTSVTGNVASPGRHAEVSFSNHHAARSTAAIPASAAKEILMTTDTKPCDDTAADEAAASPVELIEQTTRRYSLKLLNRIGQKHRRLEKSGAANACESGRLAYEAREVCRRFRLSFPHDYIEAFGFSKSKVFADIRLFHLSEQYPDLLNVVATVRTGYLLSAKSTSAAVVEAVLSLGREQQRAVSETEILELIAEQQPTAGSSQRMSTEQVNVAGAVVVIRPGKDTSPQVVEALVEAIRRIAAKASVRQQTAAEAPREHTSN